VISKSEYDIDVLKEMFKHMKILSDGETFFQAGIQKIRREMNLGGYLAIIVDPDMPDTTPRQIYENIKDASEISNSRVVNLL
jgi:hypothetical protein